ncbi:hypothetical protein CDAR_83131 [Caerostris darwini]|uniref:Secreted protein n=1 Tax=Caerostris darwini TaxID=1538125 RepID=A0AAV4NSP1_9ARAC|nr:hypothetical protein CDAR_83131 [Caerostris darwini]
MLYGFLNILRQCCAAQVIIVTVLGFGELEGFTWFLFSEDCCDSSNHDPRRPLEVGSSGEETHKQTFGRGTNQSKQNPFQLRKKFYYHRD